MSRKRLSSERGERENLKPNVLDDEREELAFHESQFVDSASMMMEEEAGQIPWKSILYAIFLFITGSILLLLGGLLYTGIIASSVRSLG